MKNLFVAAVCAAASSAALAAAPAQDPNTLPSEGSFSAGSSVNTSLPVTSPPLLSPVPEADSLALMAAGGVVAAALARRRRR